MNYLKEALELISSVEKFESKLDSLDKIATGVEHKLHDLFQRVTKIEENLKTLPTVIKTECETMIYEKVFEMHGKMQEDIGVLKVKFEDLKDHGV